MRTLLAIAAVIGLAGPGCNRGNEPAATYTARGAIVNLDTGRPGQIAIHHEAIPDFVDQAGNKVGMVSMSMMFNVTRAASLDGISVGDKVQFTFEVYWKATPPSNIIAIEKLPPETELELTGM